MKKHSTDFIKLQLEVISKKPFKCIWNIYCNDIDFLTNNKHIVKNTLGLFEYDILQDASIPVCSIIDLDTNMIYSNSNIITRQQLNTIRQLVKHINRVYNNNFRKVDKYYYINEYLIICKAYTNGSLAKYRYEKGNYFINIDQAKQYLAKIKDIFADKIKERRGYNIYERSS